MNEYNIKRLALILSIKAEIEAMKVENRQRKNVRESPAYGESSFFKKAEELRQVAAMHNEQL